MKTMIRLTALVTVVAFATTSYGQSISGSDHDFSTEAWNPNGELCEPCHTPHNAPAPGAGAPLWNHALPNAATYSHYTTLSGQSGNIDGPSKLCLGCHDGVVALDSFGGVTGTNTIGAGSDKNLGTDLTDDHPIGVTYPPPLAPAADYDSAVNVATAGLKLWNDGTNDRVECGSCHNPHDKTIAPFLRKSNAGSALCLTCHKK